jgi:hypothetical protein
LMMELTVKAGVKGIVMTAAAAGFALRAGIGIGSAFEAAVAMPQVPLDQWGPNAPALCAAAGGSGN